MSSTKREQAFDRQIDDNLKKIFEEDMEEGLPPRLRRLVEQLDTPSSQDGERSEDTGDDASGARAHPRSPDARQPVAAVAKGMTLPGESRRPAERRDRASGRMEIS